MPIRREMRWLYPIDWPQLSRLVRVGRAGGRCESCGRPHAIALLQLPDGRWLDPEAGEWRDDAGAVAAWPDIVGYASSLRRRFHLGTAHLDHDPGNSSWRNLRALCQRCHLRHDRPEHLRRRGANRRRRRALGDLFHGPYRPF